MPPNFDCALGVLALSSLESIVKLRFNKFGLGSGLFDKGKFFSRSLALAFLKLSSDLTFASLGVEFQ